MQITKIQKEITELDDDKTDEDKPQTRVIGFAIPSDEEEIYEEEEEEEDYDE